MDDEDEIVSIPSGQTFRLVRRGYDPTEVQSFAYTIVEEIKMLREEQTTLLEQIDEAERRPQAETRTVLDEAAVANFLGQESMRVMSSVRSSAEEVRGRSDAAAAAMRVQAESDAATTVHRAEENAARVRREADEESVRRRHEADDYALNLRADAKDEADLLRADAQTYAETVAQAADRDVTLRLADARDSAAQQLADTRRQRSEELAALADRHERISNEVKRLVDSRRILLESLERLQMHAAEAHSGFADEADVDGVSNNISLVTAK